MCAAYLTNYFILSVTGGPVVGCAACADLDVHSTYWTINDDMNWVKGAHQIAFDVHHTESMLNRHFNVARPAPTTSRVSRSRQVARASA